jgi:hypothetical protein
MRREVGKLVTTTSTMGSSLFAGALIVKKLGKKKELTERTRRPDHKALQWVMIGARNWKCRAIAGCSVS